MGFRVSGRGEKKERKKKEKERKIEEEEKERAKKCDSILICVLFSQFNWIQGKDFFN